RYVIHKDGGFLMMADNDGETMNGFLAHMAVLDAPLDAAAIAALGGVSDQMPALPDGVNADIFHFGTSNLTDGRAYAVVGDGVLTDRVIAAEGRVQLDQQVLHRLLKLGEQVEIDLDGVFTADSDLTYSLTASGGAPVDARIEDGRIIVEAKSLGFADFTLTATDADGHTASDTFRLRVAGDNAYAFVALPDTQNYTEAGRIEVLNKMTSFLAANKDSYNLQHVLHVGDVTGSNTVSQWRMVSDAYAALDAAGLPYSLLPGNHDQAPGGSAANHSSNQDAFFGMDRYFADSTGPHGVYDGEPDSTKNNFKTFIAPDGTPWIVLSLEFGPRDDVLRWADEVLTEYADHRAILATHHYTNMADVAGPNSGPLYAEGTGKNYGMRVLPDGVNDGRDMWDTLLSKHGNVSMMFSGHVFGDGAETQVRYGEHGNAVFQIFVNYQNGVAQVAQSAGDPSVPGNGGNGAMRIVIVDPDNKTMSTETYYAHLDRFMTASRGDPEPSRDGSGSYGGTSAPPPVQPVTYGTVGDLSLPTIEGDGTITVATLPHFNGANGLKVIPNSVSGDTGAFGDHTMVMDVFIPAQIGLVSILQTD
ncbi:MAG: metallophosphoesterase, partial [Paracoccus sp. (in: a-proteobacteria)]|nr:metallophosphoesterase [Paracoccus sp. (in: a-proteobacteria)]